MIISHVVEKVEIQLEATRHLTERLIIIAGPASSGKTVTLRALNLKHGWPLINVGLAVTERLLELPDKERAFRTEKILSEIIKGHAGNVVLLDNLEILFLPTLEQNPVRLLQSLARGRGIVATWHGCFKGRVLSYASPADREHQHFTMPRSGGAAVVSISSSESAVSRQGDF